VTRPPTRIVAALALAAAAAITGCASPRAALGPDQSTCFPALSVAAQTLHRAGRFAGVTLTHVPERMAGTTTVPVSSPTTTPSTSRQGETTTTFAHRDFCLVAYKGAFDASQIPLVRGAPRAGRYAIVVVTAKTPHRVLAVFLRDQLPRAFRHL